MTADDVFWQLHWRLPRQAPGSSASTARLLDLAGPLPARPRALDIGSGPGCSAVLLAREAGAVVTAVDIHEPFHDELRDAAAAAGVADRINTSTASMAALPFEDASFDLLWAEGSAYVMGFDAALRQWKRLLVPGGTLVLTECEWITGTPAPAAREFWAEAYPQMRATARNVQAAFDAGYTVAALYLLPESDWWNEYYDVLAERIAALDRTDPHVAAEQREIDIRRAHAADYGYTGYVLRAR
jgi:SAM-dependent methyltransferase